MATRPLALIAVTATLAACSAMPERSSDYSRTEQLAEQAQVNAQVDRLNAEAARSRNAAMESQDATRALNEEINRPPPP